MNNAKSNYRKPTVRRGKPTRDTTPQGKKSMHEIIGDRKRSERQNFARARLQIMTAAVKAVLTGLFGAKLPPDRTLADFFRSHRACGSRDRVKISSAVFALLRTWGWWRDALDSELLAQVESGKCVLNDQEIGCLIWAALQTEDEFDRLELADFRNTLELPLPPWGTTPLERAQKILQAWGLDANITHDDLFPNGTAKLLASEVNCGKFFHNALKRPPRWLRIRFESDVAEVDKELNTAGIQSAKNSKLPLARAVQTRVNLQDFECYRSGKLEIQDLASQCVAQVAAPKPGERWFDACAGAGGKTLHLAALMRGKGSLTAGDVRKSALDELKKRVGRADFQNVRILLHDGKPPRNCHGFDGVLVDAPCTGSGVWRRNPGMQWVIGADAVTEFAERQLSILKSFSRAVKPGGVLIYSTCSAFEMENSGVVEKFLKENSDFTLDPFPNPLQPENIAPGKLQIRADDADCDTMFVARFRRRPAVKDKL